MRQYASAGQLFHVEYMNYEGIANVLLASAFRKEL